MKQSYQTWCREYSLRATRTREMIFTTLRASKRPLSVPEFMEVFREKKRGINKTTLYRELENLVMVGALEPVQLSLERVSYEFSGHHHHHFVCESCHRVEPLHFSERFLEQVAHQLQVSGNVVGRHSLEFFGVCKACNM